MDARHRGPVAFDLDGVLIDSRRAVEAAYKVAGITMPKNAWGKSFREWFDGSIGELERIHAAKQAAYPAMLKAYARSLAGSEVLRRVVWEGYTAVIVTAASPRSARDALAYLDLESYVERTVSTPVCAKMDWLCAARAVCYVDDDPHMKLGDVPVIRYVNDAEALVAQIRRYL